MSDFRLTGHIKISVAAVIVVYNEYQPLIELIKSLAEQVDIIIIIDNSDYNYKVPDVVLDLAFVKYRRLPFNKGLGAGINEGIKLSKEAGAEWVLLLDQDSIVSNGMVHCMLEEYKKKSDISIVVMICPDVFLLDKGIHQYPLSFHFFRVRKVKSTSSDVDFTITSGSLIKLSLFKKLGLMDDTLFIDYIDYDFCLKLRKFGYEILFVKEAVLIHRLGENRMSKVGIQYTYHSPQRVYYQTRNRLIVVRRYGLLFPSFAFIQIFFFVLKFFKILLIEDFKIRRLKFYFSGIWHFFIDKR